MNVYQGLRKRAAQGKSSTPQPDTGTCCEQHMRAESENRVVSPCWRSPRRGVRVRVGVGVYALLYFIEHDYGGGERVVRLRCTQGLL
jgi:hypothetical protein